MADKLSNRVDVSMKGVTTAGAADVASSNRPVVMPAAYAKDPGIAQDFKDANATTDYSLSPFSVGVEASLDHLLRVGRTGSFNAGIMALYRAGTNANSKSVLLKGGYSMPVSATQYGPLYLHANALFGAENASGDKFDAYAAKVAATVGVGMKVLNRFPVELAVGAQATRGTPSNGVNIEGQSFLATITLGATAVENGKLAWNVPAAEAGFPASRTACDEAIDGLAIKNDDYIDLAVAQCKTEPKEVFDAAVKQLKQFHLTPATVDTYKKALTNFVGQVALNSKLTNDDALALTKEVHKLWGRLLQKDLVASAKPFDFLNRVINPPMLGKDGAALKDVRILAELADMQDTMLKKADELAKGGTITNQDNCDLKLSVLNTFYGALFPKRGGDRNIQNQYRPRAEALMKDLLAAAKAEDASTPGYLAGAKQELTKKLKSTNLSIPKDA